MQAHDRARDLTSGHIGEPDHGHLRDRRMRGDELLHLARADVLALADDDVLLPPGDAQEAVAVEGAEVAREEPAVLGEGVGVERGVAVAEKALRPAREDLAFDARWGRVAGLGDDADLDGADRPALAVDAPRRRIVR